MRDLPHSTRVAIATLYLRVRNARVRSQDLRNTEGATSRRSIEAEAAALEIHNSLQAVLQNISRHAEPKQGEAAKEGAKLILKAAALRAKVRA